MKPIMAGCLLAAAAALAGCSGSGVHAQCKDAATTQDYVVKWQDELAAARHAGRVTIEQVVDVQGKSYTQLGLLQASKWSEFCNHLDKLRAETGF